MPVYPLTPYATFASTGPMTRTVGDAAAMLTVMAGPDVRDWNALPPDDRDYMVGLDDGIAGLRIAFSADFGYATVDPGVTEIVAGALDAFDDAGAIVEARDPGFADPQPIFEGLRHGLTAFAFKDMDDARLALMEPALADDIRRARGHPLDRYLAAELERGALGAAMRRFHADFDLLMTPTVAVPPFAVGQRAPAGYGTASPIDWIPFTFPFNLTRQPAATVPCGFTADGLPVGLQIVGPQYSDHLVLRAARAFEQARAWHDRRPPA